MVFDGTRVQQLRRGGLWLRSLCGAGARSTGTVRELGDATVGQRAAAVWWPTSGCCRRRGHSPRLGLGMALATIGTAAAFTDTTLAAIRRHRGGPRMVAADCAGFRAGCRIGGAGDGADRAAEMPLVNLFAPSLARAAGAAMLAARARPWCSMAPGFNNCGEGVYGFARFAEREPGRPARCASSAMRP